MASAAGDPLASAKDLCVDILDCCAQIQTVLLKLKESLRRKDAAVRLQAAARGFMARRQAEASRLPTSQEAAAVCLQAAARGFLARVMARTNHESLHPSLQAEMPVADFAPGERTGELFVRQSLPMASAIRHAAVDAAYFHAVQPLAGLIQWGLRWTNVPDATICAVVVVPGMTTRHLRGTCSNTGCNSALRKALNQGGCPCTLSLRASGWGPPPIGDATHIKNWGLVRVLVLVNN